MAQKRNRRQSGMSRRIQHGTSSTRPQASVSPIGQLRTLRGPKALREWIGLSLADVAGELDRLVYGESRQGLINKQKVDRWEHGSVISPKVRKAYGVIIANELTDQLDRVVGITLKANSPWRITAWAWCACGAPFELRRADRKRCPKCVAER